MPNDQVSVEIESLAPGGDAVGRQQGGEGGRAADDGRVTFVPLAAPGERVRARIEREKGKVAWGELTAIERPGPDRVPPPCPLFGTCGGCQWQHVALPAQQAAKRAIVERALGLAPQSGETVERAPEPPPSDPLAPRSGETVGVATGSPASDPLSDPLAPRSGGEG